MTRRIFTAKLLIDGTGSPPLHDPYVVVEDGIIEDIGSGRPPEPLVQDAELTEMPITTIVPGIIDSHVHLAGGRSVPRTEEPEKDAVCLAMLAARNARIALAAGVTTVVDCGSRFGVAIFARDVIAQADIPGARIWAAGPYLTTTCGHGYRRSSPSFGLDTAGELRKAVRQVVWDGADFVKIMASGGSGTPIANRRRAQYSAEELRIAVEDAHRLNKRVHCHVNAAEAMRNCIEAGVDVLEHCNWLGVEDGTIDYDEDAARLAGKKGLFAGINCPAPFTLLTAHDGSAQDWGSMTRWDLARQMQEAGVRVSINTDAGGEGLDMLPRYMSQMVEEERATAMEVIEMTTRIPAEAIGLGGRLGSLEKGKLADMIFVAENPLDNMSTLASPMLVVKEGEVVAKDRKIVL